MMMQDKLEKERNDAKNAVEEYVYEFRDKLCGVFEKFITEEVRLTFTFQLMEKFLCIYKLWTWVLWRLRGSLVLVWSRRWLDFPAVKLRLTLTSGI